MKSTSIFSRSKKDPRKLDIWSVILPIAFDLVCGMLLILLGKLALQVTTYVLSGLMILCAGWLVVTYLRASPMERITHSWLAIGLALVLAGIMLAFNPHYLEEALPLIWGLFLLFGAFLKFQYAFDEKTVHIDKWWLMLIFSAFSLVIGILCLVKPVFIEQNRELLIGIMLLAEAVLDIVVYFLLSHALKKFYEEPRPSPETPVPAAQETAIPEDSASVSGT